MQIGNADYSCLCLRYVTSEDLTSVKATFSEYVTSRYVTSESVTSEDVTTSSNLGIIVGLSVGLALLFVITVVVVVVVVVRRHTSKKASRRRRKSSAADSIVHDNECYGSPEALGLHIDVFEESVYSTIPEDNEYCQTPRTVRPDEANKEYTSLDTFKYTTEDTSHYLAIMPDDECWLRALRLSLYVGRSFHSLH